MEAIRPRGPAGTLAGPLEAGDPDLFGDAGGLPLHGSALARLGRLDAVSGFQIIWRLGGTQRSSERGGRAMPPDHVHFNGSVNLADAETVMREIAARGPSGLRRIPDGEAGNRGNWIFFQLQNFIVLFSFRDCGGWMLVMGRRAGRPAGSLSGPGRRLPVPRWCSRGRPGPSRRRVPRSAAPRSGWLARDRRRRRR